MNMDTGIQYQLPQEMFNENKRPPGHVCDPLIRQAARTATKVLEELNLPHQIRYVDQRDHPQANMPDAFYGVQIDVEGPEDGCESARYGWTNRLGSQWEGAQTSRTHYARALPHHIRRHGPGDRNLEEKRTDNKPSRRWRPPSATKTLRSGTTTLGSTCSRSSGPNTRGR